MEMLEDRQMLSVTPAEYGIDEIREIIAPRMNTVDFVTVVTHGFQPINSWGDSLYPLASKIRQTSNDAYDVLATALGRTQYATWLLDYEVTGHGGEAYFDGVKPGGSVFDTSGPTPNHIVLLFDWAPESDQPSAGWGEAAGDALFSLLVGTGLVDVTRGVNNPSYHFIAHSFGSPVNSEAIERLAHYSVPVSQVTYLDPHDFDQGILPIDGQQKLWTLGKPSSSVSSDGYGATVWNNVLYADTYYQTEFAPDGRPIPGAYNRLVNDDVTMPISHSEVWSKFYLDSVSLGSDYGWAYSPFMQAKWPDLHGGQSAPAMPEPNFYDTLVNGTVQDHEWSSRNLLALTGAARDEMQTKRWTPDPPALVFNGDFRFVGDETPLGYRGPYPGWTNHTGGTSTAYLDNWVDIAGTVGGPNLDNHYLRINPLSVLFGSGDRAIATHNPVYLPTSTAGVKFDFRAHKNQLEGDLATDDRLIIRVGETIIEDIPLSLYVVNRGMGGWKLGHSSMIPTPALFLRNTAATLSFEIVAGTNGEFECIVDIDNVSLRTASATTGLAGIISAFNDGLAGVRQGGQIGRTVASGLGADLPVLEETVADIVDAVDRFTEPFTKIVEDVPSKDDLQRQLEGLGFRVDHIADVSSAQSTSLKTSSSLSATSSSDLTTSSLEPGPDDLLLVTWERTWNETGTKLLDFGFNTGFEYFDRGVDGEFSGSLSATLQPVTLSLTLGVDLVDGLPTFFVHEDSSLTVGGVSVTGSVGTNMAIRNLLDVDIAGPVTGTLAGALRFTDPDDDDRLRVGQFANPGSIVASTLGGSISFTPSLKAKLPIIGDVEWGGSFSATVSAGGVTVHDPVLSAPSTAIIEQLLRKGYQEIAGAFNFFGGVDLGGNLPVVNKPITEVLGLPSFLTGGGLGSGNFQVNVTPDTVMRLIKGENVDLIRFGVSGGDRYSTGYSVPIAAAAIPLGPIPLTLTLSFRTDISAGWSYNLGMGVDTVGFYIDPTTNVRAFGNVQAGMSGEAALAGIVGVQVSAGVGAGVSLTVGLNDPDPRDGKIYLDELITFGDSALGTSLIDVLDVRFKGEAYGYAEATAFLRLFFVTLKKQLYSQQFRIAEFDLSTRDKEPVVNTSSQRAVSGRGPLSDTSLPDSLLQGGVLTINARVGQNAQLANTVSFRNIGDGQVEVIWRGVGQRTYAASAIQRIVYEGNDQPDRLYVGPGVTIPVEAHGRDGDDMFTSVDAPAIFEGGDGNDLLRGGSQDDHLYGGPGDDILSGGGGRDHLYGGPGNDQLDGGEGNDVLYGGDGDDVLSGGDGEDELHGEDGDDILYGGGDNDTLYGGRSRDILYGDDGRDFLYGGDEDDILIGGAGDDELRGEHGDDVIYGDRGYPETADPARPDGNDKLYGDAGDDRLFGEGGGDELHGGDDDDLLVGDAGDDTLYGDAGDDYLLGGADNDTLEGGADNDVLNGGGGANTLKGKDGDDVLQLDFDSIGSANNMFGGLGRDRIAVVGTVRLLTDADGQVTGIDDNVDDWIDVTQDSVDRDLFVAKRFDPATSSELARFEFRFDSSPQSDIEDLALLGLGGNDRLRVFGLRDAVIEGGDGNDMLEGGDGEDKIYGGTGDDKIYGHAGNDILDGGEGRDELHGGSGRNTIYTGPGSDNTVGPGLGRQLVYAGDGDEEGRGSVIFAGAGFWGSTIYGGNGRDIIVGGSGADRLFGGGGDDVIFGGGSSDLIDGQSGNDLLVGDTGRNVIRGGEPLKDDGGNVTEASDNTIYLGINNDLRVQYDLPPIIELTSAEKDANRLRLLDVQTHWQDRETAIRAVAATRPLTPPEQEELQYVEELLEILSDALREFRDFQRLNLAEALGGPGDDTIYGSSAVDLLYGGGGNDDIYPNKQGLADIIQRDTEIDGGLDYNTVWFVGTEQDDEISLQLELDSGNNRVITVNVNGVPAGRVKNQSIQRIGVQGLGGNDTILVDLAEFAAYGFIFDGGPGDDEIDVRNLKSPVTIYGGSGNDVIHGSREVANTIYGDGGDDTIHGGPKDDILDGGDGNDTIYGYEDNDTIYGDLGHDVLDGGTGTNSIFDPDTVSSGTAPPVVVSSTLVNTATARSLTFSRQLSAASLVPARFAISERNARVNVAIKTVSQSVDSATGRATVVVTFEDPLSRQPLALPPGEYEFTARGTIVDTANRPLDGNADGTGGDAYVERFTVVPPPVQLGGRIQPATIGSGGIDNAAVAVNPADGSYVVVWQGPAANTGDGVDIYAQRYSASGDTVGSRIVVNAITVGDQSLPAVAMDAEGRFVVAWQDSGFGFGINARTFSATGVATSTTIPISTNTAKGAPQRPSVAMDAAGNFVVAWSYAAANEVFARRFTAAAESLGAEFRVDTDTALSETSQTAFGPSVAVNQTGDFAIVWQTAAGVGNGTGIYGRWYAAAGAGATVTPRGGRVTIRAVSFSETDPMIAMNANGDSIVVWGIGRERAIEARRYDTAGRPSSAAFLASASDPIRRAFPRATLDRAGNATVLWAEGAGYAGVWFDAAGNQISSERIGIPQSSDARITNLRVMPGTISGELFVGWDAPAGVPVIDYFVQYSSDSGATWQQFTDPVSAEPYASVTGLNPALTYVIRVAAVGTAGTGQWSAHSASVRPSAITNKGVQFVHVGDPGNADDTTGYGGVDYEYRIGKFEITIGQYAEFLNAVAKSDPRGLWNAAMDSDQRIRGIARSGSDGSFVYTVVGPNGTNPVGAQSAANRPITYVSWFDAARFANWMSNGKPTGAAGPTTTDNGAYNLGTATSGTAPAKNTTNPNTGAVPTFYIPTENEWYKAAYYSPVKGGPGTPGYYAYGTQSDTAPGNGWNGTTALAAKNNANQANYPYFDRYAVTGTTTFPSRSGNQNFLTDVGTFTNSASYYGAFDMSGNVSEWNDLTGFAGSSRGLRGGSREFYAFFQSSSSRSTFAPSREHNRDGFRLTSPVAPLSFISSSLFFSPSAVAASMAGTTATLTWQPPQAVGSLQNHGYVVQRSSDGGLTWTTASDSLPTSATSYQFTGLQAGQQYHLRVAAKSPAGVGAFSEPVLVGGSSVPPRPLSVAPRPDGGLLVVWPQATTENSFGIAADRYTRATPVVFGADATADRSRIVVAFSQQMAESGAGTIGRTVVRESADPAIANLFNAPNWGLRLPDGRFITQPTEYDDPRATPEQFGDITFGFSATSGRWEASISITRDGQPLTLEPGTYTLIARGTMTDAAGRKLHPDGGFTSLSFTLDPPPVISAVTSDLGLRNAAVATVTVDVGEPIVPGSLGRGAVSLEHDGQPVDLSEAALTFEPVADSSTRWQVGGLAGVTTADGVYTLTISPTGIIGVNGLAATGSARFAWRMDSTAPVPNIPNMSEVRVNPFSNIVIQFSEPVAEFDAGDLVLTRGSTALNTGSLAVEPRNTSTSANGELYATEFVVSGASDDGENLLRQLTEAPGFYRLEIRQDAAADQAGNRSQRVVATWTNLEVLEYLDVVGVVALGRNTEGKLRVRDDSAWDDGLFALVYDGAEVAETLFGSWAVQGADKAGESGNVTGAANAVFAKHVETGVMHRFLASDTWALVNLFDGIGSVNTTQIPRSARGENFPADPDTPETAPAVRVPLVAGDDIVLSRDANGRLYADSVALQTTAGSVTIHSENLRQQAASPDGRFSYRPTAVDYVNGQIRVRFMDAGQRRVDWFFNDAGINTSIGDVLEPMDLGRILNWRDPTILPIDPDVRLYRDPAGNLYADDVPLQFGAFNVGQAEATLGVRAVAAARVNTDYQVLFAGSGRSLIVTFDQRGQYKSNNIYPDPINPPADDSELFELEERFSIDLNGDGQIGRPGIAS